MEKVEIPNFVNKIDDKTLNSLLKGIENGSTKVYVCDSDKLNNICKKIKFCNAIKTKIKNKSELNPKLCFDEQISEKEKLLRKNIILQQLKCAVKAYNHFLENLQFIKAYQLTKTIEAFYSDLQKLDGIQTFSNVYSKDGIDSLVDTIRNMEYKNRAR